MTRPSPTLERTARKCNPSVALVLAGGGARGAYEIGALSVLLPYLEARGERPGVIVGTSIGALNGAYLAATAHRPADSAMKDAIALWRSVRYGDVLRPFVSLGSAARLAIYVGELCGVPHAAVSSLLDNSPIEELLNKRIDFDQLSENVQARRLARVAVVATSYASGESVVFHAGADDTNPEHDTKRAIRYVQSAVEVTHVRASAAIPVLFPAVDVTSPEEAAGWYGDGGTRLNTPIKPALKLGAERVVVIGLNSSATPPDGGAERKPDVFDGAAQFAQALLADQLAQDVATLAGVNEKVARAAAGADGEAAGAQRVPYIFVAPKDREVIGELAVKTYKKHIAGLRLGSDARSLAALGHVLDAGSTYVRGDLLSFLFFHRAFVDVLYDQGRKDAKAFLKAVGNGDPWSYSARGLDRVADAEAIEHAGETAGGIERR
jgi:NTE family protein